MVCGRRRQNQAHGIPLPHALLEKRLEERKYGVIQFRNGCAANVPEMQVEFLAVRRIKKAAKMFTPSVLEKFFR